MVTFDVLKLLKSNEVTLLPLNIVRMLVTFEVSKLSKFNFVAILLANIASIFITLLVSKLLKSILVAFEPVNIRAIDTIGLSFIVLHNSVVTGSVEVGSVNLTFQPSAGISTKTAAFVVSSHN